VKIRANQDDLTLRYTTRRLLQRMLSPLCGFDQRVSFMSRSRLEPHFLTAGAELAGVHVLRGEPKPKAGAYHIGGSGVVLEEVIIRTLGETVERYSQLVSEIGNHHAVVRASYDQIVDRGERVIAADKLRFFSEEQYSRHGFPFQPFSRDISMGWMKAPSLIDDSESWIPTQLLLVGYVIKAAEGERWLLPAVTTGSAAHTKREHALRNALLELIQIDSAMGHWYSAARAPAILSGKRTQALDRLIACHFDQHGPMPAFYWLPNPDLPGMTVACVLREAPGKIPAVVVGLGSDLKLVEAMYKALIEVVGVAQLAKIALLERTISERAESAGRIDPERIFDLDTNVAFYAIPENSSYLGARFGDRSTVCASDLPHDSTLNIREENRLLVDGFRDVNKELVFVDLTTDDIQQLGFTALRVWSPDTISLSLPSAPPANHPRFAAYGGFQVDRPHPYP
jgi:thiazole/oxazole-forming peptide maturase SagD family component